MTDSRVRFVSDARNMGCEDEIGQTAELLRLRLAQGFVLEDIERGAAEMTRPQSVDQRCFVDDTASSGIDYEGARFHLSDGIGADQVPRGLGERDVQADHIGGAQQLVQLHVAHPEFGGKEGSPFLQAAQEGHEKRKRGHADRDRVGGAIRDHDLRYEAVYLYPHDGGEPVTWEP